MDNNFSESKPNLSRAPQETELGSVPVSQWPSPYKKQVRNLEFQLTSVSRGRVRPPLLEPYDAKKWRPGPGLKLTRVQRSPLVIIARARREGPGDEAIIHVYTYLTTTY